MVGLQLADRAGWCTPHSSLIGAAQPPSNWSTLRSSLHQPRCRSAPEGRSPSAGWRGPPGVLPTLVPPTLVPRLCATGALVPSMAAAGWEGGGQVKEQVDQAANFRDVFERSACCSAWLCTRRFPLSPTALPQPVLPLPAPAMAACDSLRTTVRRGCRAARPPGGSRGEPVTKRRNLQEGRRAFGSR